MQYIIVFETRLIPIHSDINLGSSSKRRQRRNKLRYACPPTTSKYTISDHNYERVLSKLNFGLYEFECCALTIIIFISQRYV